MNNLCKMFNTGHKPLCSCYNETKGNQKLDNNKKHMVFEYGGEIKVFALFCSMAVFYQRFTRLYGLQHIIKICEHQHNRYKDTKKPPCRRYKCHNKCQRKYKEKKLKVALQARVFRSYHQFPSSLPKHPRSNADKKHSNG